MEEFIGNEKPCVTPKECAIFKVPTLTVEIIENLDKQKTLTHKFLIHIIVNVYLVDLFSMLLAFIMK